MLVLVWSADEPQRIGEVLVPLERPSTVGRDAAGLSLLRQRPGVDAATGPFRSRRMSREHLKLTRRGKGIVLRNAGRKPAVVNGQEGWEGVLIEGDVVQFGGATCMVRLRPEQLPAPPPGVNLRHHPFGEADAVGIVGESPAAWQLRTRVAFLGPRPEHVLVLGPSGAGKELVAQALHAHSDHARRTLVSRNAATLPEGLIDAELFGHAAGYPNAGMKSRAGLVGEADGSTLFLDEIGELPSTAQAHLLRVLDDGEYQRLGDAAVRTSRFRLVAATNRPETELKHDVRARFVLRLAVAGLGERPEDVPLLAIHLLREIGRSDPVLQGRFFHGDFPRLEEPLVHHLVTRHWTTHVRELNGALWHAITESQGTSLRALQPGLEAPAPGGRHADDEGSRVREALERNHGNQEATWRELGLSSRYVLRRLIQKHAISTGRRKP